MKIKKYIEKIIFRVYNFLMATKKNFLKKIHISYNAPVTLTFAILAVIILFINNICKDTLIPAIFTAPGGNSCPVVFNFQNPIDYIKLLLHIFGHSDWNHLISNLSFILLLGPVIEERYGSAILALMMTITSLVTGVLNACFSSTQLLGCSDIVFMMILLTSFTTISKSKIPLSFILILILYLGRELIGHPASQNIATFAHIAGGLCGSMFAFLATPKSNSRKNNPENKKQPAQNSQYNQYNDKFDDKNSPRFKKNKPTTEDNSTIVGSLDL